MLLEVARSKELGGSQRTLGKETQVHPLQNCFLEHMTYK
uniref:Uncharacterized protein n=1 Tax=Anguilla anguilla TaxID=7936 RepID=A0A0E9TN74_ANGAN